MMKRDSGRLVVFLSLSLFSLDHQAQAHPGVGIVMDARGDVYYTDLANVWRIASGGVKTIVVPRVHSHELSLDSQGRLYGEHSRYDGATERWSHRVWRLSTEGMLTDIFPEREGFLKGYGFARDAHDNLYWIDRDNEARTGAVIRKITPGGEDRPFAVTNLKQTGHLIAASDGTLFLTDFDNLVRVGTDGSVKMVARDLGTGLAAPNIAKGRNYLMGLWLDSSNNVYVAIYASRRVLKVEPDGEVSVAARSQAPWSPSGGLVNPSGDLWLLEFSDTNQVRVRMIAKNRAETIY